MKEMNYPKLDGSSSNYKMFSIDVDGGRDIFLYSIVYKKKLMGDSYFLDFIFHAATRVSEDWS